MNYSDRLGPLPQRVAVVRALRGLGDLLCAVPALRALRSALPKAQICLVGLPWARTFVDRFDRYLDELIEFPGYPGIPERPFLAKDLPPFLARIQKQPFDLALQMHGSGVVSNPFTALLGAKVTAGFFLPGQYCPDPDHFLPYPEAEPEIRRHLRLMEFLGIPLQGEALEFPIQLADWGSLQAINRVRHLQPGKYICIHPGAYDPVRRWSPQQFAKVADTLSAWGVQVVLTSSKAEIELVAEVTKLMRWPSVSLGESPSLSPGESPALNLAGQTSLGALAALLQQARLLVCNDTGVSHLAAALGVPSVVVLLAANRGSEANRWAPLNRQRHRVVDGLAETSLAEVLVQVEGLLEDATHAA